MKHREQFVPWTHAGYFMLVIGAFQLDPEFVTDIGRLQESHFRCFNVAVSQATSAAPVPDQQLDVERPTDFCRSYVRLRTAKIPRDL